jgi:hypothetical protein
VVVAGGGGPLVPASLPGRIPCAANNGRPVVRIFYGFQGKNELDLPTAPAREFILQAVAGADWLFSQAAKATGGRRHVRWHTPDCKLAIVPVRVPAVQLSLGGIIDALADGGHLERVGPADKILVVLRTRSRGAFGCAGLGSSTYDERSDPSNWNNTTRGFAYVHCFGEMSRVSWTGPEVLAHELLHTLGAVNYSAPNSTGYGHCTDESDVMCYVDGPGVKMRKVCKATEPEEIDCRKDDYFNTSPRPGSYLATHWNTADSVHLARTPPARWMDLPKAVGTVRMPRRVEGRTTVTVAVQRPRGTSVESVELVVDGEAIASDQNAPYQFQFDPRALALPAGKKVRVKATVYDALGRSHDGPSITVTIATS